MARLILLEDEPTLRAELAGYLSEQGHVVDGAGSVAEFRAKYSPADHLIALIDLGLPDGDGGDLIEWLRSSGRRLGIIVISARSSLSDKVRGLIVGADHYLSKPVELEELAAVTVALARRLETGGLSLRWVLNLRAQEIVPPGKEPIAVTAQGCIVLKAIASGHGESVNRRRIVEALGEDFLQYDQRRLETQIHQLRKLVQTATGLELPIRAVRNRGYQFYDDVDLEF